MRIFGVIKPLVLVAVALGVTNLVHAGAKVGLKMSEKSNGQIRFALIGEDLCPADTYRLRVYDSHTDNETWYKSNSGESEWKINKNCGINRELSHSLLEPGKVLEVRTYRSMGGAVKEKVRSFRRTIPCEQGFVVENGGYLGLEYDIADAIICGNSQSDITVISKSGNQPRSNLDSHSAKQDQQQVSQSCGALVELDPQYREMVDISVSCRLDEPVNIYVTDGQQILCQKKRFAADTHYRKVCNFGRNSARPVRVEVTIEALHSGNSFQNQKLISKDPTYFHNVTAKYHTALELSPRKEKKSLGRGYFWQAQIEVSVEDADIDVRDPQSEIRIELIDVSQQKVIKSAKVSTGSKIRFEIEAQFIEPLMFGSAHWDEDAELREGENILRVRVYDAYQNARFIDLEDVRVNVQK